MKFFDPKKKDVNAGPTSNPAQPKPNPAPPSPAPVSPTEPPRHASPTYSNPTESAAQTIILTKPAMGTTPVQPPAPASSVVPTPPAPPASVAAAPVVPEVKPAPAPAPAPVSSRPARTTIGPSVMIRGEIAADENLIIEGTVEGAIETSKDVLVGPEGKVQASIRATNIIVSGKVVGDVMATNKVDLSASAVLQGNIRSPKLSIADTAVFNGRIEMSAPPAPAGKEKAEASKTVVTPVSHTAQK